MVTFPFVEPALLDLEFAALNFESVEVFVVDEKKEKKKIFVWVYLVKLYSPVGVQSVPFVGGSLVVVVSDLILVVFDPFVDSDPVVVVEAVSLARLGTSPAVVETSVFVID